MRRPHTPRGRGPLILCDARGCCSDDRGATEMIQLFLHTNGYGRKLLEYAPQPLKKKKKKPRFLKFSITPLHTLYRVLTEPNVDRRVRV